MPKIGVLAWSSALIVGTAYLPVSAGSPGPFDKKDAVRLQGEDILGASSSPEPR